MQGTFDGNTGRSTEARGGGKNPAVAGERVRSQTNANAH